MVFVTKVGCAEIVSDVFTGKRRHVQLTCHARRHRGRSALMFDPKRVGAHILRTCMCTQGKMVTVCHS